MLFGQTLPAVANVKQPASSCWDEASQPHQLRDGKQHHPTYGGGDGGGDGGDDGGGDGGGSMKLVVGYKSDTNEMTRSMLSSENKKCHNITCLIQLISCH